MTRRRVHNAFVLIHSPLVGPTTWRPVAGELQRRSREALVPSLLGVAGAPAPQWRAAVDAVRDATQRVDQPLVLVAHSGAGVLLPLIAGALPGEVAGLIFVDAFLPPARGSAAPAPPDFLAQLRPLADRGMLPPWSAWFGGDALRELVADDRLREALEREMPRMPLAYFEANVPVPGGWDERGCAYLLLSPDPYADAATDALRRGWPTATVPGAHHLSIVTDPVRIAEAVLGLE